MPVRPLLPAAVVACLLAASVPALAGEASPHGGSGAERLVEHRGELGPLHSSDGVRGAIAVPLPAALRPTSRSSRAIWQVAPGVTYTRWNQSDARGPVRAHLLSVQARRPGVRIDYAAMGQVRQTARVPDLLARDSAIAGVNGDFFDIGATGAPLGLGQDRQRGLLHARVEGWNAAFFINRWGKPDIGTLPLAARVKQHPELTITNLNSPFVRPDGIGVYTRAWGTTAGYRQTAGQRRQVRAVYVRNGRVVAHRAKLTKGEPIDGFILIGRGVGAQRLKSLRVGTRLRLRRHLEGEPKVAISGNRILVHDGIVQDLDDRELHPRTAIGIDSDTGEVLMLVIDGRQEFSRGYTMAELARLMVDLGADEALNLDGGGSSTMVARKPGKKTRVVNSPSDGYPRTVANALEVTYHRPR